MKTAAALTTMLGMDYFREAWNAPISQRPVEGRETGALLPPSLLSEFNGFKPSEVKLTPAPGTGDPGSG